MKALVLARHSQDLPEVHADGHKVDPGLQPVVKELPVDGGLEDCTPAREQREEPPRVAHAVGVEDELGGEHVVERRLLCSEVV